MSRYLILVCVALFSLAMRPDANAQVLSTPFESPGGEGGGKFGASVTWLGDLDGDGRNDLAIGATQEDAGAGGVSAGRVHVYSGATSALLYTLVSPNVQPGGRFGEAISRVPDADGDGTDDIVVGTSFESPGSSPSLSGRAYLFSGATGSLLQSWASPNEEDFSVFGASVSGLNDADGDGRGDVIVGAWGEEVEFEGRTDGRVYVFSGASGDLLYTLVSPNPDGSESAAFGRAVSGVGDLDQDGRSDLIVGAPTESNPGIRGEGRAYVFSGASGALLYTFEGSGEFGLSVSGTGDVNGDGREDIVIGSPREEAEPFDADLSRPGRVRVYSGSDGQLLHVLVSPNEQERSFFGWRVSGGCDADGDGRADMVVSTPSERSADAPSGGRVYVYSGASGDLLYALASPSSGTTGGFGDALDVLAESGSGRCKIAVGSFQEASSAGISGRAYTFDVGIVADASGTMPPEAAFEVSPNPASRTLRVSATGDRTQHVSLIDALGRAVARVTLAGGAARTHVFDVGDLPSGVYVVRLVTGMEVHTRRVTVLR